MTEPIDIDLFKESQEALDSFLQSWVGEKMNTGGTSHAPDPVNMPMIRHWVDAFDDRNPIYEDNDTAQKHGWPSRIAPPAMMQTWTMQRAILKGIGERGGAPQEMDPDTPLGVLDRVGFTGVIATNSVLDFYRPLVEGDLLHSDIVVDSVSARKATGLGQGYFVTWCQTYVDQNGENVGKQIFTVLKFDPSTIG